MADYDPKPTSINDAFDAIEDLRGLILQLREDVDRLQSPTEGNLLRLREALKKLKAGDLLTFDGSTTLTSLTRLILGSSGTVLTARPGGLAWILPNAAVNAMVQANFVLLPRP